MFENIMNFFKKLTKKEEVKTTNSKETAKERLHLVLLQDRANVSADFLELMKQEIIEVIKKYIDVDEGAIDVRLTNKENDDGTNGAPALYANIPIINIKNEEKKTENKEEKKNKNENKEKTKNEEIKDVKQEATKQEKTNNKNEEKKEATKEMAKEKNEDKKENEKKEHEENKTKETIKSEN